MTALVLLAVLSAEPVVHDDAISLEIPGMFSGAFEMNAERRFDPHFSALLAAGTRTTLGGDFRSAGFAAGVGVRYWLGRWVLDSMRGVGGPVATLRFDVNWVEVWRIGDSHKLDEAVAQLSLRLGYRLVFFERIELTLEIGPGASFMLDGAPFVSGRPRTDVVYGLTGGYLF
ncbi:MAG: hypothetical protein QM723_31300 [Myxococcaceae bacterium]